jgi:hypothetical protein
MKKNNNKITVPERDPIAWWVSLWGQHSGDGQAA